MPDQTNQQDQEKQDQDKQDSKAEAPEKDPVRKWTFIVLGLCIVLTVLYLVADRQTPFTSQARVHAFVVPIAPQVAGNVISVEVKNNDQVESGQVLIRIDPTDYELAVASAEATLQVVKQSIDAGFAGVEAAEASVEAAKASKWRSEQDAVRMRREPYHNAGLTRPKPAWPPPRRGLLLPQPALNLLAAQWVNSVKITPIFRMRKLPSTRPVLIWSERFSLRLVTES